MPAAAEKLMFSASGAGCVAAGLMMNMTAQAPVEKSLPVLTKTQVSSWRQQAAFVDTCARVGCSLSPHLSKTQFFPQNDAHGSQVLSAL